jgi:hypothetical protein
MARLSIGTVSGSVTGNQELMTIQENPAYLTRY